MGEQGLRRDRCEGRGYCLVRGQVPAHERVLDFQAVNGKAGLRKGSQDQPAQAGRQQHLASGFPSGLGAGLLCNRGLLSQPPAGSCISS